MSCCSSSTLPLLLIIPLLIIPLTLRLLLSPHPHSGLRDPSHHHKYGDFEAQRHWKEMLYGMGVLGCSGEVRGLMRMTTGGEFCSGRDNHDIDDDGIEKDTKDSNKHQIHTNCVPDEALIATLPDECGIQHWYHHNLTYWGLDYPPLTAYHEYLMSLIISKLHYPMIQWYHSRGLETWQVRMLMRMSVIMVDLVLLLPGIVALGASLGMLRRDLAHVNDVGRLETTREMTLQESRDDSSRREKSAHMGTTKSTPPPLQQYLLASLLPPRDSTHWPALLLIMSQPALLLIDNAHFQYNNFSIGLTIWAIFFCATNRIYLGSIFFTLALNYKIIALYYALPFFFYLLGRSFFPSRVESLRTNTTTSGRGTPSFFSGLLQVGKIGIVVLGTFFLCWLPFLTNDAWKQVLKRIFPFERGLFEDYVANFWCTIQPLLKFISRRVFQGAPIPYMTLISASLTLLGALPANFCVLLRPTLAQFLYALSNTSLVFFMTSFHVHEKTILFPLMVISFLMLLGDKGLYKVVVFFSYVAAYSMYPLMIKDALQIAYWSLMILFFFVYLWPMVSSIKCRIYRSMCICFLLLSVLIQAVISFVPPPGRFPYLFVYALTSLSFVGFLFCWVALLKKQWQDYRMESKMENDLLHKRKLE